MYTQTPVSDSLRSTFGSQRQHGQAEQKCTAGFAIAHILQLQAAFVCHPHSEYIQQGLAAWLLDLQKLAAALISV